jgi:hypothetical protein
MDAREVAYEGAKWMVLVIFGFLFSYSVVSSSVTPGKCEEYYLSRSQPLSPQFIIHTYLPIRRHVCEVEKVSLNKLRNQ